MNNNEILTEYFIWEENNSIEPKMKSENKTESEPNDSMTNTKIVNELENWKTITDPKLRRKMRQKAWRKANPDKRKRKEQKKAYWEANKDKIKLKKKAYREANKEKVRLQERMRDKKKRQTNINFKLSKGLRTRLWSAIKDNQKAGSAVKDLGCSIDELKSYLESKFQPRMTWDNYGLYGWHIDHIKPLSSFDLSDRKQFLEACHYTNLQPLWASDNLSKHAKISNN